VAQINPHIEALCTEMSSLHRGVGRQVQKAFDSFHAQITVYLSADQRAELEKFQSERRSKRRPSKGREENNTNPPAADKKVNEKCELRRGSVLPKV
jgi:hypothetical protein